MSQTVTVEANDRLDEAIVAYFHEIDAGREPDLRDWLARHPGLEGPLAAFLENDGRMRRVGEELRPPPPEFKDRRIGEYELEELIGVGGMGVVWKARHCRGNFSVALKMILSGGPSDRAAAERFVREAELHASLNHAHIIPIYDVGEHDGVPYFTMKLIESGTLKSRLDRFRLVPRRRRRKGKRTTRGAGRRSARRIARLMALVAEA